jgi:hypothetical protein
MNGSNPTENRISWTALALNHCLRIHQSIKNMQIRGDGREETYVKGTVEDAQKLSDYISKKFGFPAKQLKSNRIWKSNYWYEQPIPKNNWEKCSDQLEQAFTNVADLYLKHQRVWDNADQVEEVEESDSDSEGSLADETDLEEIEW